MTPDQLRQIMPNLSAAKASVYFPLLEAAMAEFEINNLARQSAFIAQLAHESGELRFWQELASGAAYEGRKDLGNTEKGDGKRYKGRGPIQITGRANYKKYGDILGLDLINDPELAANPEVGFRLAGAFWRENKLNVLADLENFKAITKRINGGYNGLTDRQKYYKRALKVLANGDDDLTPEVVSKPEDIDKGVTTSTKAPDEVAGTPPPAPASEVKASQPSLFTRLGSLSVPAGAMAILTAIGKFFMALPPWAWVVIVIASMAIGYLIWREAKRQAHERTLLVMKAAADPESNNLRLI